MNIPDFGLFPQAVILLYKNLSKTELGVFLTLCIHANRKRGGLAWPSHTTISEILKIKRARVQAAIKSLLKKKLIEDTGKRVGRDVAVYRVSIEGFQIGSGQSGPLVAPPPITPPIPVVPMPIIPPVVESQAAQVISPPIVITSPVAQDQIQAVPAPNCGQDVSLPAPNCGPETENLKITEKNNQQTESFQIESDKNGSERIEEVVVVFPDNFSNGLITAIKRLTKGIPTEAIQSLVFELGNRWKTTKINNPLGYFNRLLSAYKAGQFVSAFEVQAEQDNFEKQKANKLHQEKMERIRVEERKEQEAQQLAQETLTKKEALKAEQLAALKEKFIESLKSKNGIILNFFKKDGFESLFVQRSFDHFILENA